MTSASPVDTKVTGAASANREAVQAGRSSMGDTSRKIGQPMLQVTETEKATGNEECSEWSDEEMRVLQTLAQSKCWQALSGISAQKLLQGCLQSRALSTVKKYLREGVLYLTFLRQHRLPEVLPTSVEHVSLYLSLLLEKNQASAVSMAYSGLKWIHGLLPIAYNPLDVGLCQKFVDAERRRRKTPILKKQPASLELIKKIADTFANESATFKDLRLATMTVISFAGLFRSKELLNI